MVCLIQCHNQQLIPTPKELAIENERLGSIKSVCRLSNGAVTPLHYYQHPTQDSDANANNTNTNANANIGDSNKHKPHTIFAQSDYHKLQTAVEDESMLYYLTQVRRCKRKHSLLHHGKFIDLLPFAARYCIKIAIFYEFQGVRARLNHHRGSGTGTVAPSASVGHAHTDVHTDRIQKSAKYWAEAYKNIQDYYIHLQSEHASLSTSSIDRGGLQGSVLGMQNLMDAETESQITGATSISVSSNHGQSQEESSNRTIGMRGGTSQDTEETEEGIPPPPPMDAGDGSQSPSVPPTSSDDGVEVALVYSPKSKHGKLSVDPPPLSLEDANAAGGSVHAEVVQTYSDDMLQQCRAVADLLNLKLLLTAYAMAIRGVSQGMNTGTMKESPEDVTFAHIAKQIRTHAQIFLSVPSTLSFSTVPPPSSSSSMNAVQGGGGAAGSTGIHDPSWLFLAYVARQRAVISEFLQKYPVKIPSNQLTTLDEETPLYCNASQHYVSCAEAFLKLGASVKKARWNSENGGKDYQVDNDGNDGRQRYIGCLAQQDLVDAWKEELGRDHQGE